jgi:hypothetical protein
MTSSAEQRRARAIARARERRRAELEPLRVAVDDAISGLGWRRVRPVVEAVMGFPIRSQRGAWWSRVGKRNGGRLLVALSEARQDPSPQLRLFAVTTGRTDRHVIATSSDRPVSRTVGGGDGPHSTADNNDEERATDVHRDQK